MDNKQRQDCINQLVRATYELEKAQSTLITDDYKKEQDEGAAVRVRDVLITMEEKIPASVILMVKILENYNPEDFALVRKDIEKALYAAKCEFGV